MHIPKRIPETLPPELASQHEAARKLQCPLTARTVTRRYLAAADDFNAAFRAAYPEGQMWSLVDSESYRGSGYILIDDEADPEQARATYNAGEAVAKEATQIPDREPVDVSVNVDNGIQSVTVRVRGGRTWQSKDGSRRRVYYDVTSEERSIVSKLYEVTAGDTRDATVVVEGRTFGYEFGIDTGSQTKRANAANAVERLAQMIVAH